MKRFCSQCGAERAVASSRFCTECGAASTDSAAKPLRAAERKTLEERRAILAQVVMRATALGARIESQSDTMAVLVEGKSVNHILHLILTIVTFGFWAIVWIILAITGGEKRQTITVDVFGKPLIQRG